MLFLTLISMVFVGTLCMDVPEEVFKALLRFCPRQFVPINNMTEGYNISTTSDSCCTDNFFLSREGKMVTDRKATTVYGQTCLFPYVKRFQTNQQKVKSYNIITLEPKHGCKFKTSDTYDINDENRPTCNDSEVSQLRRFLPVYSENSSLIYKNPQCAYCHGQFAVETWKVLVTCTVTSPFSLRDDICTFYYVYNGDPRDIDHLECFTDEFSVCQKHTLKKQYTLSTSVVDLSMINVEQACELENLPRFAHRNVAKNVFCYMCHYGQYIVPPVECFPPYDAENEKIGASAFIRILDPQLTTTFQTSRSEHIPKSCIIDKTGSRVCLPTFCPLGQARIYTDKGMECELESIRWTVGSDFSIYVSIKFEQNITVNESVLDMEFWKSNLHSPFSPAWYVDTLYHPILRNIKKAKIFESFTADENRVDSFDHIYIKLMFKYRVVHPKSFITSIQRSLQKNWRLDFNKTIIGRQDLSQHTFLSLTGFASLSIRFELQAYNILSKRLSLLYKAFQFRISNGRSYVINKLMFCNNVELERDHVNVLATGYSGPVAISVFGQNRILYDNEFTSTIEEFFRFRVCVSDMAGDSTQNFKRSMKVPAIYLVVFVIVVFFEDIC